MTRQNGWASFRDTSLDTYEALKLLTLGEVVPRKAHDRQLIGIRAAAPDRGLQPRASAQGRRAQPRGAAAQRARRAPVQRAYNQDVAKVNAHDQRANRQNAETIAELNRRQRTTGPVATPRPSPALADRVQEAVSRQDDRKYDVFLSYARIDGSEAAAALKDALEHLDVRAWFDEVAIRPGQSQALQMDRGLRPARCGVALLTAAYLAGRFWTERELGALLHKETLIPVLHGVTFEQVAEYAAYCGTSLVSRRGSTPLTSSPRRSPPPCSTSRQLHAGNTVSQGELSNGIVAGGRGCTGGGTP